MATQIKIDPEFIRLCRSMREAQKVAKFNQRDQRRASSLEQLFDAKLSKIEQELKAAEKPVESGQLAFDVKKVN
jgi:hypothetical protein